MSVSFFGELKKKLNQQGCGSTQIFPWLGSLKGQNHSSIFQHVKHDFPSFSIIQKW
jgi:hypothetical protein